MRHLYASVVRGERLGMTQKDGVPSFEWSTVEGAEYVRCRLDLNFVRPGKDIAPAPVAGKAPDRIGLLFCDFDAPFRAGDRVVAIPDHNGLISVEGTFEIRVIPDVVVGFATPHHKEIQILETNQALTDADWPEDEVIE